MIEALDIEAEILLSTDLNCVSNGAELIVEISKAVEATSYLNGDGAGGYLDPVEFVKSGVDLIQQNFKHPSYSQHSSEEFVPGMSIIDPLMNLGIEGTAQLIKNPLRP